MTVNVTSHWHVETGIAGYGPEHDGSGFHPYENATQAASAACDELRRDLIDMVHESARGYAEEGEKAYKNREFETAAQAYRDAWLATEHADSLDTLARNLDSVYRSTAPMYVHNPDALEQTMRAIIDGYTDTFGNAHPGAPFAIADNLNLYVWECDNSECTEQESD